MLSALLVFAAHIGGAEGIVPFFDGGVLSGAGTTHGLIFIDDDGSFAQTCEESAGGLPNHFVSTREGMVTATNQGVFISNDPRGCDWTPIAGTEALAYPGLAPSPVPGRLWAISSSSPSSEFQGELLRRDSDDDDDAFVKVALIARGGAATSLVVTNDDVPIVAGVVPTNLEQTERRPFIAKLNDDRLEELSLRGILGMTLTRVLTIDNGALWYSALDGIGRGHLWREDFNTDIRVGSFDGLVTSVAHFNGKLFVLAAGGLAFSAPLDEALAGDARFTRLSEPPFRCLLVRDDVLIACGTPGTEAWFLSSTDGETFEPLLSFAEVKNHQCPEGTSGARGCAYLFVEPVEPEPFVPRPFDSDLPGCAQVGGAPLIHCALLALAQAGRRRRARREHDSSSS